MACFRRGCPFPVAGRATLDWWRVPETRPACAVHMRNPAASVARPSVTLPELVGAVAERAKSVRAALARAEGPVTIHWVVERTGIKKHLVAYVLEVLEAREEIVQHPETLAWRVCGSGEDEPERFQAGHLLGVVVGGPRDDGRWYWVIGNKSAKDAKIDAAWQGWANEVEARETAASLLEAFEVRRF